MNHHVPDFELDDIYPLPPASSGLTIKSSMAEEEIMELVWQNGQIITHSQNQRSGRRSSDRREAVPPTASSEMRSVVEQAPPQQDHLFMQEDEMASWLHYPLHDTTFERDIGQYFNPPPPPPPPQPSKQLKLTTSVEVNIQAARPPVPKSGKQKEVANEAPPRQRVQNFAHFKKLPSAESVPKETTVVEPNDTPKVSQVGSSSRVQEVECGTMSINGNSTRTSSPGDSSASVEPPPQAPSENEAAKGEDRKRKGREADDNEDHSLDNEFEFGEEKKQARGSTSTKRSRAAEVHNLSERRRRDRINERMKTLQELIPRCNKTDKASMLDEAIEYLKSLQMQIQMMSMGCGMVPIMYPGIQQYMPAMGMGMGMGMAMDMSMARPLVPYSAMVQGSTMPNPAAGAQMAPRFPMSTFHMPVVHDPSRMQAPSTVDPLNPMAGHSPPPNITNAYQHYLGPQQGQVLIPQSQAAMQNNVAKPSTSREDGTPENH